MLLVVTAFFGVCDLPSQREYEARTRFTLEQLRAASKSYLLDTGRFPASMSDLDKRGLVDLSDLPPEVNPEIWFNPDAKAASDWLAAYVWRENHSFPALRAKAMVIRVGGDSWSGECCVVDTSSLVQRPSPTK
jgi:hypothetical protein